MRHNFSFLLRARRIQNIVKEHYEPGRQDRSLRWVYEHFIRDEFGIAYKTFLKSYHTDTSQLEALKEERDKKL